MSAPTFTPGPWGLREVSDPTQHVYLIESSTGAVALVQADGPEATATAHLLKAAPTMYEALRAIAESGAELPELLFQQVVSALAEAVQP